MYAYFRRAIADNNDMFNYVGMIYKKRPVAPLLLNGCHGAGSCRSTSSARQKERHTKIVIPDRT